MGIQENMSKSIRSLKEVQHKSLVELSEELEISRSTLQKYLDGHGNPSLKMVEHLAEKLHVDPIFLLAEMFEPSQQEVVLLLMDTIKELAKLPQSKRVLFAKRFLEIIHLWDDDS